MDVGLLVASLAVITALVWAYRRTARWGRSGPSQASVGLWTGGAGASWNGDVGGGDFGGGGGGGGDGGGGGC